MSILELICDFQISPLYLENTSFKTHHTLYTVVVFFSDIQIFLDMVVAKHLSPLPGRSPTCWDSLSQVGAGDLILCHEGKTTL